MASGKSTEKKEERMVTIRYRKDGKPIHRVDKAGNPIPRERLSKKERMRRRREEKE
jgi:hypothetical protein